MQPAAATPSPTTGTPNSKRKTNPPAGFADTYSDLVEIALQRAITADEVASLAAALPNLDPWLEWAGKVSDQRWNWRYNTTGEPGAVCPGPARPVLRQTS